VELCVTSATDAVQSLFAAELHAKDSFWPASSSTWSALIRHPVPHAYSIVSPHW
jgi:uncharacterized protein with WD repeat